MISTGFPYAGAPWCIGPGIAAPGRSIPDEGEGYPWGWWERLQYSAYNVYICNDMCAYHVYSYLCIYIYKCVCCEFVIEYIPRPSNDTFICVSILFCSCCGFSLVCKKLLFCRKNARGGSFLPHCQLDLLQLLNLRPFAFFLDICVFCAQIFVWTSVASKQTIPVFSRARVAKRK